MTMFGCMIWNWICRKCKGNEKKIFHEFVYNVSVSNKKTENKNVNYSTHVAVK